MSRRRNRGRREIANRTGVSGLNIGVVLFGVLLLYIIVNVIVYIARDKVSFYEVVPGTSAADENYSYTNALILRNETVYYSDSTGYINFYVRESSRLSAGTTLYSIDKTGAVTSLLSSEEADLTLSDEDIASIQTDLSDFTHNFDELSFIDVYDFKSTLEGTIIESVNSSALESIYDQLGDSESNSFHIGESEAAGIVEYTIDNYETFESEDVTADDLDTGNYVKAGFESGDLVSESDPIYKLISSEKWNIVIALDDDEVEKYSDTSVVTVKFLKDDITSRANFEIFTGADGGSYALLTLYNYMIRYASDRYIDIQIVEDEVTGLKIPKTSLVSKDFYIIPLEYAVLGGESDDYGFMVQTYDDDGEVTTQFMEPDIFYEDDEYYYIDTEAFDEGTVIVGEDTSETYALSETATLVGVYNINNGYTKFVQVNILAETDEYYIVESETTYGLVIYDHIILDSSTVSDNQVIFR